MELASWIFMSLGAFLLLSSALGVWRMPDFFSRLHPAGMADSMGVPLILIGIALQFELGLLTLKILLLIIFYMLTSATATHVLAKSALVSGQKPVGEIEKKGK